MARSLTAPRRRRRLVAGLAVVAGVLTACSAQVPQAVVQSTTTLPAPVAQAAPIPSSTTEVPLRVTSTTVVADVVALPITSTTSAPAEDSSPAATETTTQAPVATTSAPAPSVDRGEVVSAVRVEASDSPPYEIETIVPALIHPDDDVAELVNEAIDYLYAGPADLFRSDMEDYFGGLTADDVDTSTFTADFETTLHTERLLSLRLTFVNLIGGSDLATVQTTGAVFDLATGGMVAIQDVVRDDGMAVLADLVEAEVIRTVYAGDAEAFAPWEASIGPDYFGTFTVGPTGFQFGFNQFEVGDDTTGAPVVVVPYEAMLDLIDPVSAVGASIF